MKVLKNESGIALITAIMLLVILTIIGLAAVNTMQTERDIASGETAYRIGFYHADSGISYARTAVRLDHVENKQLPIQFSVPDKYCFALEITRAWQNEKTGDWRYIVESTTVPKDSKTGTVTVQAEIKLATAQRGAELNMGNETTY